ncbi:MAG: formate/nitrite transporter family protein [Pseudomonadota bacterium]
MPSEGEQRTRETEETEDEEAANDHEEARRRASPSAEIVYEAVRAEGLEELDRSTAALAWSGIAAGLSMGFSLVAQGLLKARLPDTAWAPLLVRLGYSVGFLVVVLGRQQLFTENTLTPIIPYLAGRSNQRRARPVALTNILRLWTVVLLANLVGAFAFAVVVAKTDVFSEPARDAFDQLSSIAARGAPGGNLLRGIFAGWLIALMVWLLPVARGSRITVIVMVTYLVGLGDLTHVIAGAVEVFYLPFRTEARLIDSFTRYLLPTLVGNVVGGVTLTAALNHAQVVAGGERERDQPA